MASPIFTVTTENKVAAVPHHLRVSAQRLDADAQLHTEASVNNLVMTPCGQERRPAVSDKVLEIGPRRIANPLNPAWPVVVQAQGCCYTPNARCNAELARAASVYHIYLPKNQKQYTLFGLAKTNAAIGAALLRAKVKAQVFVVDKEKMQVWLDEGPLLSLKSLIDSTNPVGSGGVTPPMNLDLAMRLAELARQKKTMVGTAVTPIEADFLQSLHGCVTAVSALDQLDELCDNVVALQGALRSRDPWYAYAGSIPVTIFPQGQLVPCHLQVCTSVVLDIARIDRPSVSVYLPVCVNAVLLLQATDITLLRRISDEHLGLVQLSFDATIRRVFKGTQLIALTGWDPVSAISQLLIAREATELDRRDDVSNADVVARGNCAEPRVDVNNEWPVVSLDSQTFSVSNITLLDICRCLSVPSGTAGMAMLQKAHGSMVEADLIRTMSRSHVRSDLPVSGSILIANMSTSQVENLTELIKERIPALLMKTTQGCSVCADAKNGDVCYLCNSFNQRQRTTIGDLKQDTPDEDVSTLPSSSSSSSSSFSSSSSSSFSSSDVECSPEQDLTATSPVQFRSDPIGFAALLCDDDSVDRTEFDLFAHEGFQT